MKLHKKSKWLHTRHYFENKKYSQNQLELPQVKKTS